MGQEILGYRLRCSSIFLFQGQSLIEIPFTTILDPLPKSKRNSLSLGAAESRRSVLQAPGVSSRSVSMRTRALRVRVTFCKGRDVACQPQFPDDKGNLSAETCGRFVRGRRCVSRSVQNTCCVQGHRIPSQRRLDAGGAQSIQEPSSYPWTITLHVSVLQAQNVHSFGQ